LYVQDLTVSNKSITFVTDNEPFLRPVGSKRAELERKQAGGSESGVLRGAKRQKVERIEIQITAE
jgi:hypothetical protein